MDTGEILLRLQEVIRDELDNDAIELKETSKASDIAGWDSLAHIRILVAVEESFGVRFSSNDIAELKNVGDLVAAIQRRHG